MDRRPAGADAPAVPTDGALAALTQTHDLPAIERLLLAWATHPHGAAFDTAALYVWSAAHGCLVGRLAWTRDRDPEDLASTLARALRGTNEGPDPDATRRVRATQLVPRDLAGAAALGWGEGIAIGATAQPAPGFPAVTGIDLPPAIRESRSFGAARLARDGRPLALLVGEWIESGDASARHAALAELRRAGDAALRLERARADAGRRSRQMEALGEFADAVVSPLNLAEVLELATRLALETVESRGVALWLADRDDSLALESTQGAPGSRERIGRTLTPLASRVAAAGRPRIIERTSDEPDLGPEIAGPIQSLVLVPLVAYGVPHGALAVYDRVSVHPAEPVAFDAVDSAFLTTLGDHLVLAIDQARRADAMRELERRCEELQRQLARRERLAALGEMAAQVAHEVRNPLASIGAFARRAHRQLGEEDPGREYLEIVIRESERLERMVGEQLQYATLERPRLKLESVNVVVQEALQAAGERLVRRRVRLLKRLSPDLPPLLLDNAKVGRAVANILDHALDAVSPGGRLRVESRRSGAYAVVEIAHDGQRHPGELLDQLFVPFAVSRQGGEGVGLAVAQQVLKQHGGEIRLRGDGEWSSVFSFTLPIPENEDRRRPGRERRATRSDRRTRTGAA